MGALKGKPAQGLLIAGKKYKAGTRVLRRSKVKVQPPDTNPTQGVKLGVRIADDQDVEEFTIDRAIIHALPRDSNSEQYLNGKDPAAGETWRVWSVPRDYLPGDLKGFRTTFKLTKPRAIQTVKWAVVYADQTFDGGYVIFGHADVGWNGAEKSAVRARTQPAPRRPRRRTGSR
jgi:hypothetical protein